MRKTRLEKAKKGDTFAFYPGGALYERYQTQPSYVICRRHGSNATKISDPDIVLKNGLTRIYIYD